MLMKCICLSCQTFNVTTKRDFNFARSPTSSFSEFAVWNFWCVRSKSHVFFSFFGLVASKTYTSPSIFKTYCNTLVFLLCECLVYVWGGWGLRNELNLNFEIIISSDICCFRYFSCSFAIGLVLSRKRFNFYFKHRVLD